MEDLFENWYPAPKKTHRTANAIVWLTVVATFGVGLGKGAEYAVSNVMDVVNHNVEFISPEDFNNMTNPTTIPVLK